MLAGAMLVHRLETFGADVDLFFFPVIAACIFFRSRGLWLIPLCLILNDVSFGAMRPTAFSEFAFQNSIHLIKWLSLGLFTVVTLSRYSETRRHQMLIQKDVALARTLQRALMPHHFESPSVRVDARIHQTWQIGGDLYYFRPFKEKYVVLTLGDIMGKGIPASMVMAIVMGFFYEWGKQSFSPAWILERLNERLTSLWANDDAWFVTLFYAIYDEETHELVFSSGGHQAALLLPADPESSILPLKTEGLPVGIFPESIWEEKRVTLEPGDRVVVFTDGVNEARNGEGEIFTMDRLEDLLRSCRTMTPNDIVRTVVARVREWANGELSDDLAILVMEVKQ